MANSTHICQILTMTRHASDEKRDLDDQRSNVVVESYQFGTVLPFSFFPSQTKKSNSSNPKPGENKSSKQKTLWSTASCPWKLFIVHVCKLLQQCNRIKQNILQKQLISLWSSHVVLFNLSLFQLCSSEVEVIFCHIFIIVIIRHLSPCSDCLDDNNRSRAELLRLAEDGPWHLGQAAQPKEYFVKIINIAYGYTDLSRIVFITISFQLLSDQDVFQLSFFIC